MPGNHYISCSKKNFRTKKYSAFFDFLVTQNIAVVGPALPDLSHRTNNSISEYTVIVAGRATGYMVRFGADISIQQCYILRFVSNFRKKNGQKPPDYCAFFDIFL